MARVKCFEGHELRIKVKYHYGNARYESVLSFAEFLKVMQTALAEMPGNSGRESAVFSCINDLTTVGRGEFGWTTYSLEGN